MKKLKSTPIDSAERVIEIEIERLHSFRDHPFCVTPDIQMIQLRDSIAQYGILTPLIVRPTTDGCYEIISGHRRRYAAELLGFRKLPVIIRYMPDDEAIISMVDANLQRDHIKPSEKAFAYKMKYDAIIRRQGRKKKEQIEHNVTGKRSVQILSEETGDSAKQVQRYLKITSLIPELIHKLDNGEISFNPAYEIAFLSEEEQKEVLEAMEMTQSAPSLSQAQRIKRLSKEGTFTSKNIQSILAEVKQGEVERVVFKNEQLYSFFPREYTADRMRSEILDILRAWMKEHWNDEEITPNGFRKPKQNKAKKGGTDHV